MSLARAVLLTGLKTRTPVLVLMVLPIILFGSRDRLDCADTLSGVPGPEVSVEEGRVEPDLEEHAQSEGTPGGTRLSGRRIIAYYISWAVYVRDYHPLDIPAEKITHVNYAFANIGSDLRVAIGDYYADVDRYYPGDTWDQPYRGAYNQLNNVLRAQHPHLKTFISVGGWTWSTLFSDVALTPESRARFAASCVEHIRAYNFDGVDIDWEYPVCCGHPDNIYRPEDRENFTLLLAELRTQLDSAATQDGRQYLLTIAAPAGYDKVENIEIGEIAQHLDWINVMCYDFRGAWDLEQTAHHAALYPNPDDPADPLIAERYTTDWSLQAWLAAGVPPDQPVMGVPFYGRAWGGVPPADGGLFQPASAVPPGTWDDWASGDTGVNDFWEIEQFAASGNYTSHWDEHSLVAWLYSPDQNGGHFISFNDTDSMAIKVDYVHQHGLGGMMLWEITADRNETLLDVISAGPSSEIFTDSFETGDTSAWSQVVP